jgi:DNA-binding response OmpR family regulator
MKTIVIIDDSKLILKVTKTALEHAGYQVTTLLDPGDFEPATIGMPDLLLVDINMPTFYGDDVVSYIKETWNLTVPIFLFSNVSEKELELACSRCGADGYISKGWGMEAMIASVQTVLGRP